MRDWLREIRKSEGFSSCEEAAAKIGCISASHYTSIENGTRSPHPETAKQIADALNFSRYEIDWTRFFQGTQDGDKAVM